MSEPKRQKYDLILQDLLDAIERRDGEVHVLELREKLRARVKEGMEREAAVQVIAEEPFFNRVKFLCLYPELVIPYIWRVRRP